MVHDCVALMCFFFCEETTAKQQPPIMIGMLSNDVKFHGKGHSSFWDENVLYNYYVYINTSIYVVQFTVVDIMTI